ncbi:uncharacterized protein LOC128306688 [Anopheles moucheti]|uniref:uncharacterized protein LOC128306688 n=1 Tax=Anopheles moucheti TaxID=186751 RepID=UPI0022F10F0D|nr:uncharacterized protein LOC128306688 [Anopheles moucheti]
MEEAADEKREDKLLIPHDEPCSSRAQGKAPSSKYERCSSSAQRVALERLVRGQGLQLKLLMAEKEKTMAEAELKCKLAALEIEHEAQINELEDASDFGGSSVSGYAKTSEWMQRQSEFFEPQACSSNKPVQQHAEAPRDQKTDDLEWRPTADHIAARQVWPKKLPAFSGKPREWPKFYCYFVESTKACKLSPAENVARLEECLKGPAREAVEGWLDNPSSVSLIVKTLKRLYGRPSLVVKDLVTKVRGIPAPKPERLDELITFGLAVQHLCSYLKNEDLAHYLTNSELLEEMVEKLPASRQLEWVRYSRKCKLPTMKEFGAFMDVLVDESCEVTKYNPQKPVIEKTIHRTNVHNSSPHLNDVSVTHDKPVQELKTPPATTYSTPCHHCKKPDHKVRQCEAFKSMSPVERLEAVTRMKVCINCLADHGTKPCRSRYSCGVPGCGERHHSLLHQKKEDISKSAKTAQCQTHQHVAKTTLFRVVPVTIHNGEKRVDTHAFLDEGSSVTLVEASLTASLGIKGVPEPLELNWTANVKRIEDASQRISLEISARGGERRYLIAAAHTVNQLSLPSQSVKINTLISSYDYLQDLPVHQGEEGVPQILIGLENVNLMKPLDTRAGQPGQPIAVKTVLGWAIYGPHETNNLTRQPAICSVHNVEQRANRENDTLNEMLRQYFTLEETVVTSFGEYLPEPQDVVRAKQLLESTTEKRDGRFTTGLLWKSHDVTLPTSLAMATKRLHALERKLEQDPQLKKTVHEQMHMYIDRGYAHRATEEELAAANPKRIWYLPLNVVGHPHKPDKKRLVWDAAAKVQGVSLNSCLLKGPDLLAMLPGVLCVFRQRKIAFGGDIEKMFHQIRIRPEDTHSQRFLFRFDQSKDPDIYLMDVATFGATCSPCSAQYVMHRNADEHAKTYPIAAAAIKRSTYVDDYFDSCDTREEAIDRVRQVKFIHSQAGLNMRNWVIAPRPEPVRLPPSGG